MENIERTMQFILEQQAQFGSNIQKIEQEQQALWDEHKVIVKDLQQLTAVVGSIAHLLQNTNAIVERLAQQVVELSAAQTRTVAAQVQTDERLNALITAVERHLSNHS
jgi:hypothetical protein